MKEKFNEKDVSNRQDLYENLYKKAHLKESNFGVYSGIIESIKIDYLYEYLSEVDARLLPRNMEDLDNMGIRPLEAIRAAMNGRSFIGGDFNLTESYFVIEEDKNFLSIPERKLRDYLEDAIYEEGDTDFIQWCLDKGYVGRESILKADKDYYIGDIDWD